MCHYILSARFARGQDEILSYAASGYLCAIPIEREVAASASLSLR